MKASTRLEQRAELQLRGEGLGPFAREHRFAPPRMWRFDFAWPERKVALEVEGGVWSGGRHTSGAGFRADCEKYGEAAIAGWIVIRASPDMVRDRSALHLVKRALQARLPEPFGLVA